MRCARPALVIIACLLLSPAIARAQTAPADSNFQKVVLDASVNQPMELAVAPDGRVFFLDRTGKVEVYRPASGTTVTAASLSVDVAGNHGLLGLALDPAFATNRHLYLYYSPTAPSVTRLSRFTVAGDAVDLASERVLIEIPTQRICCHEGGSIAFDASGNLFVSTGDNTNPFESSGYAPIDERAGREAFDVQRSSANTKDLRGKILRIRPQADGTYTIPTGNLFTTATAGRPEIYAMGMRNPFRISVDSANGWLYVGDVGPDATSDSATRGPKGYDEINQVKSAGNYGWPYCIANNKAYNDYNFATSTSGALFNCAAPTNNSPNNTGASTLPAARPAWIWYPYGSSTEFPTVGTATERASMTGPVYHFNSGLASSVKLPSYYDNRVFIFDWSRDWIQSVKVDTAGAVVSIERFLPSFTFTSPIDVELGADGALYVLEWGAGSGHDSGADAKLSRIQWKGTGGANPVAIAKATPDNGLAPLTVTFSSAGSNDPEGGALSYAWDFTANGTTDSTSANPSFTYSTVGNYTAKLTVRDPEGKTGVTSVAITAGNTRPTVTLTGALDGGFFGWAESVAFSASVNDPQDGSTPTGIACNKVQVIGGLGHDEHSHTDPAVWGCTGTLLAPPLPADHADGNVAYVVEASYTDRGSGAAAPLTGRVSAKVHPKHKQAEHYTSASGVVVQTTADSQGGARHVGDVDNGDWIAFSPVNLMNISSITFRVASGSAGGTIEVRSGSTTGTLLGTATVAGTGGWNTFTNVTANVTNPGGPRTLYFVFKGATGDLLNLNWMDFNGAGVSTPAPAVSSTSGTRMEAELAALSGATVSKLNPGYTGTGYGDYNDATASGTWIEWTVNAPVSGTYALEFRYANGSGASRPLEIRVGTTVLAASLAFPHTGAWSTWSTVRVNANLLGGTNKVRATTIGSNGPNVDSLSIPLYQAENAAISSAAFETMYAGYSGTAYVNYAATTGGYTEWTVQVPTAATYTLVFRYALGATTGLPLQIKVGGAVVNSGLTFPPSGAWTTWSTVTITAPLAAGANKIRATATGVDGPNLDALIVR